MSTYRLKGCKISERTIEVAVLEITRENPE